MDWSMDLWHFNNVKFLEHEYANDRVPWSCFLFLCVMILFIFSTSDPSNLTNHILEFSKNVIKTSLILLMHFNIWIRLKVNINKDTTTTSVMLFWCFTYFEHNNFEHILHTLFYGFYHWLWTGSCPLDLASYSFR